MAQIADGGVAEFVEVMGQDLRRQAHCDAFGALCQEQRELHGQRDRFIVAAVVALLPLRGLGVEDRLEGELRELRLNISGSSGRVAGEDVTPVALGVDEQAFLAELHEGVADGSVAVGVELHGVTHDVGHLVISAVVHAAHGVQDAALHGFQTVLDMRYGTLQDDIAGIVEEPVLVHSREMMHGTGIEAIDRLIVRVLIAEVVTQIVGLDVVGLLSLLLGLVLIVELFV